MSNKEYFTNLIDKYISGSLTAEENETLRQMLDADENQPELERILLESFQHSGDDQFWSDQYRQSFVDKLTQKILNERTSTVRLAHRVHFIRRWWWAAAILIIGTTFAVVVSSDQQPTSSGTRDLAVASSEIAPGGERAILTLADGRTIALDSAANGQLANQGGVKIIKLANGQISYDLRGLSSRDVMWNTMSTPKGGQYQVTLPDGTKVWLNASSAITFPTAFITDQRQVKIQGEVYFEVAKNKQKPFIVDVDGKSSIQVLGTSFNVNSYADEGNIKTTLIEGSVKVLYNNSSAVAVSSDRQQKPSNQTTNSVVLKPGQQVIQPFHTNAVGSSDRQLEVVNANVAQALAWKDGIFDFTGADLKSVMKQLERWYDIKVQYKGGNSNMTFDGRMYRNVNLSDVLQVLQEMGVKFELDGKNLIVL